MAARPEPRANTWVKTRRTLMPRASTISGSWTPARMIMPIRVFFNSRVTPTRTRMPISTMNPSL